jgi:hypothetical protein
MVVREGKYYAYVTADGKVLQANQQRDKQCTYVVKND